MDKKTEFDKDYVPKNGSMAPNEKDMKNLGKQMENRRTNKELKQDYDKYPDPIQYDSNKK
ncbi:hypothetical protein [Mesobacillus harenae]|uniref:hypothetical protein n=1 Tax=Mesobacillus harenae TaxID=2213203 RepID=UPI001580061A|nr:hypothetical protein [Mesobacillus harenae]